MTDEERQNTNINRYIYREVIEKLLVFVFLSILIGTAGYFLLMWILPDYLSTKPINVNGDILRGKKNLFIFALIVSMIAFAFIEYIDVKRRTLLDVREKGKISYDIYQTVKDRLTAPEQEAARRWILKNIDIKRDDEDLTTWYERTNKTIMSRQTTTENDDDLPEGAKSVKLVLNCFDDIGFIAQHYWDVESDGSLDWISSPIAKVWRRIDPYVLHVRMLRKTTDYYLFAEHIGALCIGWRTSKGLPDEEIARETP